MENEDRYQVREVTPERMRCVITTCPAVYEGVKDVASKEFDCGVGPCPGVYEAKRNVYLIVGRQIKPEDAGLEQKVGVGEVLIEVPRELIDERGREVKR